VTIRVATQADAPTLAALEIACFAEPWSAGVIAGDLNSSMSRAWLAESAGVPTGYLIGAQVLDEFTVARLASVPGSRRTGTGRALLRHAIASARASGVIAIFLEVRASNVPAICLYESEGFVITRRRKGYYADGEDALDMKLTLEVG
jgi:ribosomal-protein-alanine N-acetyltransferase